jgi:hypothetical protein
MTRANQLQAMRDYLRGSKEALEEDGATWAFLCALYGVLGRGEDHEIKEAKQLLRELIN